MKTQGYSRSQFDNCVYFKSYGQNEHIYLLHNVDDMLVAAKDMAEINKLKKMLSSEFEMKDLGKARRILGMDISRDRNAGVLKLSQTDYLDKVLRRFSMDQSKPVQTPMGSHFKLSNVKEENKEKTMKEMQNIPYCSAVGSVMYAMVGSRPDLAYAVGLVSRFMSAPDRNHWEAVKWLLRYIKFANLSLTFKKSDKFDVKGFCDSDYAYDLDRRRSITGYVFQVGENTISWRSGLQQIVALSTTEAEYMALVEATKEALWLKGITGELGFPQETIEVFCDSQSAICLAKNNVYHDRTKHMAVRMSFLRETVSEGSIVVTKIGTLVNPADILTKSVPIKKFEEALNRLGVLSD